MKTIQQLLIGGRPESLKMDITAIMKKENVPGLSITVIDNGHIVWSEGFGFSNVKTRQPVSTETIFTAASLTKTMSAYVALKMYEKGLIDIDTPLNNYLPQRYIEDDPNVELITMRHVLSHTTGFPNWRGKKPLKTLFTPGAKFRYSGEGFVFLQKVMEHITQQPLDIYMKENLLKPMGLDNSNLNWIDEYKDKVIAYGHGKNGIPIEPQKFLNPNAAGTLFTTSNEYAKFLVNVMDNSAESEFMLTEKTKNEMMTPQIKVNKKVFWGLGCGIVKHSDCFSLWHWGSGGGVKNFYVIFPEQKSGMVIFTNGIKGLNACYKIIRNAYDMNYEGFSYFKPGILWFLGL